MKLSSICLLILCQLFCCCSSHLAVMQQEKHDTSVALDEIRIELADIKHTLSNTQVELQILDEKLENQEGFLQKAKLSSKDSAQLGSILTQLEKRLSSLEKAQEKIIADVKQFSTYTTQSALTFKEFKFRISELEKDKEARENFLKELASFKGTLSSLTQAMKANTLSSASPILYKVKAGDSLEKIARQYHIKDIESLKKFNGLTSDKIVVGQQIKIPNDEQR